MAKATATETFNCSVSDFYKIICDYEKYPEFLKEVSRCRLIESKQDKKLVEYSIDVIKKFTYQLWMTESLVSEGASQSATISWELAGGDLFKTSSGSWKLSDDNGKTRAVYNVETTFKAFVPGMIEKALVQVNLPNMMSSYHKRVSELYGR
jgi:coenzyme Q-binding protein COQ10